MTNPIPSLSRRARCKHCMGYEVVQKKMWKILPSRHYQDAQVMGYNMRYREVRVHISVPGTVQYEYGLCCFGETFWSEGIHDNLPYPHHIPPPSHPNYGE